MFADQDLKNFNLLVDSIDDILERADKHLRWCPVDETPGDPKL
jgi:hypothetical protein